MHATAQFATERLSIFDGNRSISGQSDMRYHQTAVYLLPGDKFGPFAFACTHRIANNPDIVLFVKSDSPAIGMRTTLATVFSQYAER
jgi:hypothetical protein